MTHHNTSGGTLLLSHGQIVTPDGIQKDGWIWIEAGKIVGLGQGQPPAHPSTHLDVSGQFVAPGFIDLHTHGGNGADFSDGTVEAFHVATQFHARHGVTALQATTTAVPLAEVRRALEAARAWRAEPRPGTATMLGVHVEGPYLNPAQRGCQPAENIRAPQPDDIDFLLSYADVITEVTLAPEMPGSLAMIDKLAQVGILVSAGHSNAYQTDVERAMAAGLKHVTHIYSCMSSMKRDGPYRVPGLLEMALTQPNLTTEMIADGKHLPPALMQLVLQSKGTRRLCLVSDAMRGAGLPEGQRLTIAGVEAIVKDGVAYMADFTGFAGSITPLDQMVRNVVEMLNLDIVQALEMVTHTPARVLGIDHAKGKIALGLDADLVVLSPTLAVNRTIIDGQVVFQAQG